MAEKQIWTGTGRRKRSSAQVRMTLGKGNITVNGVPVDEYKCNVFTLPAKILELLNDPALIQLFTYRGQTGDAISSGSASENIEE